MKKLLLILILPFVSCITITKNYYHANTVVECKHAEQNKGFFNMPNYSVPVHPIGITTETTPWYWQGNKQDTFSLKHTCPTKTLTLKGL